MNFINRIFPSAPSRVHRNDFWKGKKKPFAIAVVASSIILQILFLLNYCYLFGSLFHVSSRTHNLSVLMVNYDQGVISQALQAAASSVKADSFPGVHNRSVADYPTPSDVYNAVRDGDYWAAIYTHSGATERLSAALQGNNAATFYNSSDVITYVFNEARYAASSDGYLKSSLEELVQAARITYNHMNGTGALQTMNQKDGGALQVFLSPWKSNAIDIQPTTQGDRVLYNTVTMVLPIIMQFFCLMAINGISAQFGLYGHLPIGDNAIVRNGLACIFTFIGSLCLSGAIWAFKESWSVGGGQFMCTWLILWLYMHINFLVMDVATAFIPIKFLPFFVITWVVVNVTSTIFPFELSPGFYRIGYVFPAHETWQVLVQIFSGGAPNRLYQALPILFAYEILLLPASKMAMHHRCIAAAQAEQEEREEEEDLAELEKIVEEANRNSHEDDKGEETVARSQSIKSIGGSSTRTLGLDRSEMAIQRTPTIKRSASTLRRKPSTIGRSASTASRREYWPAVPVPFGGRLAQPSPPAQEPKQNEAEV